MSLQVLNTHWCFCACFAAASCWRLVFVATCGSVACVRMYMQKHQLTTGTYTNTDTDTPTQTQTQTQTQTHRKTHGRAAIHSQCGCTSNIPPVPHPITRKERRLSRPGRHAADTRQTAAESKPRSIRASLLEKKLDVWTDAAHQWIT